MRRTALALATTALLTSGAALATGSAAAASATVIRESVSTTSSESGLTDDCRPGVTGELNGVGVTTTQSVENAAGFHIHGTISGTGRIDWSDGTFTLIDSVDRFAFDAVGKGTTTFSETHVDSGDFYSADGVFQFRQTFHEVEHFTETNGVVRVDVERGHFHFFGDC
jgi:hypothetical protein